MLYNEDITSPLDAYSTYFRQANAEAAEAVLNELVQLSGIDADVNKGICDEIHDLEKQIDESGSSCGKWKLLRGLTIFLFIAGIAAPLIQLIHLISPQNVPDLGLPVIVHIISALVSAANLWLTIAKINPKIKSLTERLKKLKEECEAKTEAAWDQMRALNDLFDWSTVAEVIRRTVPNIVIDNFFSRERLDDLKNVFGWTDDFNRDKSILFCHSGDLNGNPFVLGESLNYNMGTKTYTGTLTITWQETETYTDSEGNVQTRTVTKEETLYAEVEKPCPEYNKEKFLIYGNEAAPDLSFTRVPSTLSSAGDNWFDKMRLKQRLNAQQKKARKDINYTMMSNRTFEALFGADDRDNEIQFRLLYTALAQQETVKLLQDKTVGFGDDFIFWKRRKINIIVPEHLRDLDISASPGLFRHYELARVRELFLTYNEQFFRAFYFAMAPLLAIPLYQQTPPPKFGTVYGKKPDSVSFWECESIANGLGEKSFRHPDSITRNILKTNLDVKQSGDTVVSVTAYGFRGIERIDYVSKYGGDGHWHDVPVHWIEYIPVQKTSPFVVRETPEASRRDFTMKKANTEEWRDIFRRWGRAPADTAFRRGVVFWKQ